MREKIKHHPMLTAVMLIVIFYIAGFGIGGLVKNPVWFSLAGLGLILYILSFFWSDRYELVCPQCNHSEWDKTNHYCSTCGVKLVFKAKQKVKKGEEVKPEKIPEPCCSKGHRVYGFDKYCGKCGEKL